jgi:hypothetical protein
MVSRYVYDGCAGGDFSDKIEEVDVVDATVGVEVIGDISVDYDCAESFLNCYFFEGVEDGSHSVEACGDGAPICEDGEIDIFVFGGGVE